MKNKYILQGNKCFIELTQNQECVIDAKDMELIAQYRWRADKKKTVIMYVLLYV